MPGYQTKQESIAVHGVDDLLIRSLMDRQQFSDPLHIAERMGISSATWPIFGLLWPSGAHLAARMALRAVQPAERILEMGCGLALASLVGHRRGADVTASDCHPLTETFLLENLRLNHLPPMKYRRGDWADIEKQPVCGDAMSSAQVTGQFDLIMGSDVLYDRSASDAAAGFIGRHAEPGAEVWIIDPERGNRAAFSRHMADLGFALTEQRLDTIATPLSLAYKGRLMRYLRQSKRVA
jgi:predicted nicotinamide N-methyase